MCLLVVEDEARVARFIARGLCEQAYAVDLAVAGSGAGLGLAIARLVAEAHGGRLELLRSDERGSIFIASLPAPEAGAA
jgi:K+-sensing histidine kinase KdpD